jgi:trigger factor
MLKTKINKLPKSEIEIEGEIPEDIFEGYFNKALKILGENIKIDGFRKGKIPEAVLLQNIPEISILEKMAELALNEHYPKIITDEKIDVIARPEITITKLARKNPLGFKIKTAVLPEIKLPDYKKIAKKILGEVTDAEKNIVVSDEDLENTIKDILKSRAPKKHVADVPAEALAKEGGEVVEDIKEELPEFNDEFVKNLGPFKDVADFKDKLKINIKLEKENAQKEKTRVKIIEKIIEDSELELPEILVEIEVNKILQRMEADITQMGLKFEDYLKHLNKTIEDLRKDFRGDGEKKAKLGLLLNEISKVEKITADPELVAKEVAAILEHYKDADPERAQMHAENVLTNEKIFQFLESQ